MAFRMTEAERRLRVNVGGAGSIGIFLFLRLDLHGNFRPKKLYKVTVFKPEIQVDQ